MYSKNEHTQRSRSHIATLLKQTEVLFHTQDLAILWGITNRNTLHMTISRYLNKGILYGIQRGLYSTILPETIPPTLLAHRALHRYSYISCETVLFTQGIISQKPQAITMMSSVSKQINVCNIQVRIHRLHDRFLYHPAGMMNATSEVPTASTERAIADILYINPFFHFDAPIDWKKIKELQHTIGYPLTQRS